MIPISYFAKAQVGNKIYLTICSISSAITHMHSTGRETIADVPGGLILQWQFRAMVAPEVAELPPFYNSAITAEIRNEKQKVVNCRLHIEQSYTSKR